MLRLSLVISTFTAMSLLSSGLAFSANQEAIYGSQLMTQEEKLEYRKKQFNAKTDKERTQLREEHQLLIQQRAKERSNTAPTYQKTHMGSGSNKESTTNWGGGWESGDY